MIRVLRLMEYEFKDYESADFSMNRWAVPPNGAMNYGSGSIRSSIIMYPVGEVADTAVKAQPEDLGL